MTDAKLSNNRVDNAIREVLEMVERAEKQHTLRYSAGPWELDSAKMEGTVDTHYQIIHGQLPKELSQKDAAYDYPVADTMNRHYCISPEEDRANAYLIAAAPEMYEALQAMVANANWEQVPQTEAEFDAMIAKAEAALAKARGDK